MCMFYPLPVLYPLFYILILNHDHKLHNIIFAPFLGSPGTDDLSVDLQELNKRLGVLGLWDGGIFEHLYLLDEQGPLYYVFQIINLFVVEFVGVTTRFVLFSGGVK